jgi:sugar/nucleoside kinase (ribokinase family)
MLRRGAEGSLVRAETGEMWAVPACPGVVAADPTGCGNAYCGGFLAAWAAGERIEDAAVWGAVSASFMLETQGMPPPQLQGAFKPWLRGRASGRRPVRAQGSYPRC